ncbi:MAG TPA: TIGR03435 family protein [Bryobacteraceae bacterium]|nr:TIGR03435 family protein [Bryobacteraceae bacterium]
MKRLLLRTIALAASFMGGLYGQNISGTWQGTLTPPQGRPLRIVVKISRADNESLKAVFYSIDQPAPPINVSSVALQGAVLKMDIPALAGSYEGKLAADGNNITGTWSQGVPIPLNLLRATAETAWAIPDAPPPPRLMPADAKPTFEVATIKPSNPDQPGQSILVGRGGGNLFTTTNTTLKDLIVFAYGLHTKQVAGGPGWMESEKYDISGKPDTAGIPNVVQLQSMVQKMLEERFQLTFHKEKREMSAYAITIGKSGLKIKKTENNAGSLPGFGGRGPGDIIVRNATMTEFAGFLQSRILERPVVDQTNLTDRFDFGLKWTPDSVQSAAGSNPPPTPEGADAPPDLFTAFLQELGLKIESVKTPVEVMVIDKVEKASAN